MCVFVCMRAQMLPCTLKHTLSFSPALITPHILEYISPSPSLSLSPALPPSFTHSLTRPLARSVTRSLVLPLFSLLNSLCLSLTVALVSTQLYPPFLLLLFLPLLLLSLPGLSDALYFTLQFQSTLYSPLSHISHNMNSSETRDVCLALVHSNPSNMISRMMAYTVTHTHTHRRTDTSTHTHTNI